MQPASPLWAVLVFNALTDHGSDATGVYAELAASGAQTLSDEQEKLFHRLADEYASKAYAYADANPGGRDRSQVSAAMLVIQSGCHAAELVDTRLGIPGNPSDHGMWALSRALIASTTWSLIERGTVDTWDRIHRVVNKIPRV